MSDELARAERPDRPAPRGEILARADGIAKAYGDCVALKSASIEVRAGLVHAVCGENGAGKSTLLKVVAGMIVPDTGSIEVMGSRLSPHTPREAIQRGVGMVLQHFALVPVFTALENIVLGAEPVRGLGVLDLDRARAKAKRIAEDLGVEIPLDTKVESLGVGDRQRLEIARALYRDAKLLILDEPTAVLTKTEANALYATLKRLARPARDGGEPTRATGVVVITHKMDEVRAHADVVTVLRKGELVFTKELHRGPGDDVEAEVREVSAAIMGAVRADVERRRGADANPEQNTARGDDEGAASRSAVDPSDVVLALDGVTVGRALDNVSFEVRAREIVGIAGVEGNGQRELVEVIAGELAPEQGSVKGQTRAVVREDRHAEGLVLDATLRDNLVLGELDRFTTGRGRALGLLDLGALETEAQKRLRASAANDDLDLTARSLSGGNQQKIVVARALARLDRAAGRPAGSASPRVLVASQPTRGVDLAASMEIHARLREAAAAGAGVVVLSADLDELRRLCHRILVIARGAIVADVPPHTSDEELGKKMLGLEGGRS